MLKFLTLAAVLLAPFAGHAGSSNSNNSDCQGATLKDFQGCFINWGYSAGGLAGSTAIGTTQTNVSQSTVDQNGNGTVNFISYSVYAGTPGSLVNLRTVTGAPSFTYDIDLLYPSRVAGTVTLNDFPATGDTVVYDFVGIKKCGKVQELVLNFVASSGPTQAPITGSSILFSKRQ